MNRRLVRVGLAVGGVALIVWLALRDTESLESLGELSAAQVAWILFLQCAYLVTESIRMEIVVEQTAGVSLSSWWWLRVFTGGRLVNMVVPQGGNVYRALALKEAEGIGYASFGGGMGAFLWLNVTLNLAVASGLTAWRPPDTELAGLPPWIVLGAVAAAAGVAPVLAAFVLRRVPGDGKFLRSVRSVADTVVGGLTSSLLLRFVAVWVATLAVVFGMYAAVLDAVGAELGPGEIIALYALLQVASFIVITPGNLGLQELGLAGLASVFGVPAAQGVAAAALIRVTGLLALVAIAVPFGWTSLRRFITDLRAAPTE